MLSSLFISSGWAPHMNPSQQLIVLELEGFDGVRLIDRRGSDIELRVHNTLNDAQWCLIWCWAVNTVNSGEKSDMGLRWTAAWHWLVQPELIRCADSSKYPTSDEWRIAARGECICCVDKRRDTGAELYSRFFLFPWKENLENSLETLLKLFSATLPQFQERAQCSPACICAKAYFHPCQQKNRLKVWLQQTAGSPSR